jgi:L-aspartate oxidase
VLGHRAGLAAASSGATPQNLAPSGPPLDADELPPIGVNLEDVTYSLKSLMWRQLGIEREASELDDAIEKIELWSRAIQDLTPPRVRSFEVLNMLTVARLVALGAAAREESRGVHFRHDHPEATDAWRAHSVLRPRLEGDRIVGVALERQPLGALCT